MNDDWIETQTRACLLDWIGGLFGRGSVRLWICWRGVWSLGLGEYVAETATSTKLSTAVSQNYPVIHVDGSYTIAENAAQVARHFGW